MISEFEKNRTQREKETAEKIGRAVGKGAALMLKGIRIAGPIVLAKSVDEFFNWVKRRRS